MRIEELLTKGKTEIQPPTRLSPRLAIPDAIPNYDDNHIFKVNYVKIKGNLIGRIKIDKEYYYILTDIQKSTNMSKTRSTIQRQLLDKFSFKVHTMDKGKLARVMRADGIVILLRRSTQKSAMSFLEEFLEITKSIILNINHSRKAYISEGLLDLIVRTDSNKDRVFLKEVFDVIDNGNALGGTNNE